MLAQEALELGAKFGDGAAGLGVEFIGVPFHPDRTEFIECPA